MVPRDPDDARGLAPIGRFSALTGLTVKALRLYDARGLLRPAFVDFRTGFRYYRHEQVETGRRIRELRDVEMPLEAIRALLAEREPEAARIRLAQHRRWLEARAAEYGRALHLHREIEREYRRPRRTTTMEERPNDARRQNAYRCSFCGKENAEVERLIAGPKGVYICDECVELCAEIIARERAPTA